MSARPRTNPMRENVGNCSPGMLAKRLLSRMKKNNENSSGTKRMKSWLPMTSRPKVLRTKPYIPSPTYCSRPGTMGRLADAARKNRKTSRAARTSWSIGFVTPEYIDSPRNEKVASLPIPGRLKSTGPGASNSSLRTSVIPIGVTVSPASSALVLGLLVLVRRRRTGEAHDRQPETEAGSDDDPDRDEELRPQPAVGEPPEHAVDADAGDQVAEPLPRVGARTSVRRVRRRALLTHGTPDDSSRPGRPSPTDPLLGQRRGGPERPHHHPPEPPHPRHHPPRPPPADRDREPRLGRPHPRHQERQRPDTGRG